MAKNNGPAAKFRIGLVTATVWRNETHFNVVLTRSFKDDKNEWAESEQLGHADLMNAVRVLQRSEDFISQQQ